MRHATDPDHIVAVTTIVSRERSVRKAASLGALWGVGHTITLLLVGGTIIAFKIVFDARLGLSLELCVAIMLIVLGLLNLFDVRMSAGAPSNSRPFFVGVVHGLAGSAAAALLIVPLMDDPRWAALYLVTFGLGTIVGMSIVTISIAAPSLLAGGAFGLCLYGINMYGFTIVFPWFEAARDWITLVTHVVFGVAVAGAYKMLEQWQYVRVRRETDRFVSNAFH